MKLNKFIFTLKHLNKYTKNSKAAVPNIYEKIEFLEQFPSTAE